MTTILPNQILPIDAPAVDLKTGKLMQNWWLLFYNMAAQILGNQNSTAAAVGVAFESSIDLDAATTDPLPLWSRVASLEGAQSDAEQYASILAVQAALQMAQEPLLQDVKGQAQAVSVITPGASPYSYTASFDGSVAVTAGTVSAIALIRQGTSVATGLTVGVFPVSRLDQLKVTYSGTPTMTFIPR